MITLQDELERSFGDGPSPRPVETHVAAGRRALRRRQGGTVLAALVTVSVLGTTYAVSSPDGERSDDHVATGPSNSPSSTPEPGNEAPNPELGPNGPIAELTEGGGLLLKRGTTVVRRVENPMGYATAEQKSLALIADRNGKRYWLLLDAGPDGGSTVVSEAGHSWPTFDLWLEQMVALKKGEPGLALVTFGEGETLVPGDGVEMLDQRASPELPDTFAEPGDRTAVAMVRWRGERWFVLAQQDDPGEAPLLSPTAASVLEGNPATIDAFLELARVAYSGGPR